MNYECPMIFAAIYDRIRKECNTLICKLKSSWLCWLWGIEHTGRVFFEGKAVIRTRKHGDIVCGKNIVFSSYFYSNLVGLLNPTVLDTRHGGHIEIGDFSGASSVVISSRCLVRIGERCKIGGNVRIFDHDFHSTDASIRCTSADRTNIRSAPVEIGNDCFIGTNAIILKGTRLGDRVIVAAGSVVFGLDVPPDSLVKGNPAIILQKRKLSS